MATAGQRDRLVTIEGRTTGVDASFGPVETWAPILGLWASRVDTRQEVVNERLVTHQVTAPFEAHWELPYRVEIDPELVDVSKDRRLVYEGRVHDIIHAEPIGRHAGVKVLTLARQG